MNKFRKITMTLALLIMAVTGAWAQSTLSVVKFEVPADWANNQSLVTAGDLTGFKASTFDEAQAWTGAPAEGHAYLIYAFDGDKAKVLRFSSGEMQRTMETSLTKLQIYNSSSIKFYYTGEITEWELKPDETGKNWILADMPANNVELQVEYFAESNLFLGKDALADKTSIAVKAGDLGVQFGEDGKSANTVTEGTAMTVTYNGTKKILGFKAEKKATVTYPLLSAATTADCGKVVCAAGHLHDAKTAVPDGCTAVGILGKVTETGHGLILALKDAAQQSWNTINGWTSVTAYAGTTLKVLPDDAARGTNLTSYTKLGETTVSNWAVAQIGDYDAIFKNLGSTKSESGSMLYDDNVNAYITTGVGGTALSGEYWSAAELNAEVGLSYSNEAWSAQEKIKTKIIRPVLGF